MGARLPKGAEICGIKASVLKPLLYRGRFDSVCAAKALRLEEPEISSKLRELEAAGWIDYVRIDNQGFEEWQVGPRAPRLLAAKIGVTTTIQKAEEVVTNIIKELEAAFADQSHSKVITEAVLFGSTLRGGDASGIVGDVDIALKLDDRYPIDAKRQKEVEDQEREGRSFSNYIQHLRWGDTRIFRRIKNVASRVISTHDLDEIIKLGAQRQTIWKADPETGKFSTERGPLIGSRTTSPEPDISRPADYTPSPDLLPWRKAAPPAEARLHDRLFIFDREVRHLWMRGLSERDIAKQVKIDVSTVLTIAAYSPRPAPLEDAILALASLGDIRCSYRKDLSWIDIHSKNGKLSSHITYNGSEIISRESGVISDHYQAIRDLHYPLLAWAKTHSFVGGADESMRPTLFFRHGQNQVEMPDISLQFLKALQAEVSNFIRQKAKHPKGTWPDHYLQFTLRPDAIAVAVYAHCYDFNTNTSADRVSVVDLSAKIKNAMAELPDFLELEFFLRKPEATSPKSIAA